jgi:hypothetical protein
VFQKRFDQASCLKDRPEQVGDTHNLPHTHNSTLCDAVKLGTRLKSDLWSFILSSPSGNTCFISFFW